MLASIPMTPHTCRTEADVRRFWSKVALPNEQGCMLWLGYVTPDGYGRLQLGGKMTLAHRAAYTLVNGPIPRGLTLDHLCRVRHCVAPPHLEPVAAAENTLRGEGPTAVNARKTHCGEGHLYDEENTYLYRGKRHCRACHQAASIRHRARKGAQ